ncbi:MAG TPA: hypothetical protein VNB49_03620 [Candidatus Dormibacteraeota bacterium]|nr:hypothetical protein [Candidatus Dormibacteraeota bacterium]
MRYAGWFLRWTQKQARRCFSTTQPNSFNGNSFLWGGAAVRNPPTIDVDLRLVYLSVGNVALDILGENRAGDNLYAASIVALDVFTGNPVGHFQEVHHDIWDYDRAQPAVLFAIRLPLIYPSKRQLTFLRNSSSQRKRLLNRRDLARVHTNWGCWWYSTSAFPTQLWV